MIGGSSISSNNNRAVPGSNPLNVHVLASHRSAIAVPDFSCFVKNKKIFFQ